VSRRASLPDYMNEPRTRHASESKLRAPEWLALFMWPAEANRPRNGCRPINSKHTWHTARAGDAVLVTGEGETDAERYYIESITLYRVSPTSEDDCVVPSGQAWLDRE
jgi:hypothetical protein